MRSRRNWLRWPALIRSRRCQRLRGWNGWPGRFLLDALDFDVSVESGIVTIAGFAGSSAVALTLIAAIGNEGTVAVHDRLSYPPA
jgi:hypothetical protein